MKKIALMAAGTGGHIMPGLAITQALLDKNHSVVWFGTSHGMENKLVPQHLPQLERITVEFAGLRGKGKLGFIKGGWQLIKAFRQARKALVANKVDAVIGMGGYICVPGAWAAKSLGLPLLLVNADVDLLLSNKTLLSQARVLCCGFAGSAAQVAQAVVTGNPVRASIAAIAAPQERFTARQGALKILVLGGSLGAQVLNSMVPQALALTKQTFEVTHQCGEKHAALAQANYEAAGVKAQVASFIDDMAAAYAAADIVIARSGAITVSELCAAGVGSFLVPFVASTTAHQIGNAKFMQAAGASELLLQSELTAQTLAEKLNLLTREKCQTMAQAARSLAKANAAQAVCNEALAMVSSGETV